MHKFSGGRYPHGWILGGRGRGGSPKGVLNYQSYLYEIVIFGMRLKQFGNKTQPMLHKHIDPKIVLISICDLLFYNKYKNIKKYGIVILI